MTPYLEFECDLFERRQNCLLLKLKFAAFFRARWIDLRCHYCQERSYNNFKTRFYLPGLRKWVDLLIKDCLPCQTNKASGMHRNTTPELEFVEIDEGFSHRISMDTKGPIHPALKRNNNISVICDEFTHFVATKPTPLNDSDTKTLDFISLAHRKY